LPCYRTLQTLYNLYDRADYEAHLQPLCLKRGLGVLTYFSPASGFLSGKCRSENDLAEKAREEMVRKYLADRGLRILDALERVAKQHRATPAAVSLAWLMFASRHNRAYRKCHESQTAQGIA
jgi:aryl-alcohol dehydrogenase-like predicted oxidoreductase